LADRVEQTPPRLGPVANLLVEPGERNARRGGERVSRTVDFFEQLDGFHFRRRFRTVREDLGELQLVGYLKLAVDGVCLDRSFRFQQTLIVILPGENEGNSLPRPHQVRVGRLDSSFGTRPNNLVQIRDCLSDPARQPIRRLKVEFGKQPG
jgi:hypothetical protein